MLRVTWEWLGQGPALDLADTVTIVDGEEHDLLAPEGEYARWARLEAELLPEGSFAVLCKGRRELMDLRAVVREVLGTVAAGERPPRRLLAELNRVSRGAPEWLEIDPAEAALRPVTTAGGLERVLARYARSAMELVADESERLRRCPAPSCGMFYLSTRPSQRWCSTQCGTRARVARHYAGRRRKTAP
ncbi:MAG TPA: ABATE domain-containing protein [Actinomycetota bacterium]|nr:ABATE domain-containing protein [Actinomycetota bacterium]